MIYALFSTLHLQGILIHIIHHLHLIPTLIRTHPFSPFRSPIQSEAAHGGMVVIQVAAIRVVLTVEDQAVATQGVLMVEDRAAATQEAIMVEDRAADLTVIACSSGKVINHRQELLDVTPVLVRQ